jgi:hypothetical protein
VPRLVSERLASRLTGLCARAGLDGCDDLERWVDDLPERVCLEPLLPCIDPDGEAVPFAEAIEDVLDAVPALEAELGDPDLDEREPDEHPQPDGDAEDAGDDVEEVPERGSSALGELFGGLLGAQR